MHGLLLLLALGVVAGERSLLDANPALFPPNPATITVPSGDLIATPITPDAPYSQAALVCNVSGNSSIPLGATFPLTVKVPVGGLVRVIFANGNLGGTQVTQQGEPGVIVQQGGIVIVQQGGSASPIVQNVGSPIVQQPAPPAALVVQQTPTVIQPTPSFPTSPVVQQPPPTPVPVPPVPVPPTVTPSPPPPTVVPPVTPSPPPPVIIASPPPPVIASPPPPKIASPPPPKIASPPPPSVASPPPPKIASPPPPSVASPPPPKIASPPPPSVASPPPPSVASPPPPSVASPPPPNDKQPPPPSDKQPPPPSDKQPPPPSDKQPPPPSDKQPPSPWAPSDSSTSSTGRKLLATERQLLQDTVPGGPNNGLVEYVALASNNTVPGFVVPNTAFGVPYIEFTATAAAIGQTAVFKGVLEVALVIGGVPQIPFVENKSLSPECQVNVNFEVA